MPPPSVNSRRHIKSLKSVKTVWRASEVYGKRICEIDQFKKSGVKEWRNHITDGESGTNGINEDEVYDVRYLQQVRWENHRATDHCSSTVMDTLAIDGWTFTFSTARKGYGRAAAAPPSPLLAVPNVTVHTSTASVPTSYYSATWYYNCLCTLKG